MVDHYDTVIVVQSLAVHARELYVCTERSVFHMPDFFVNSFVRGFSQRLKVKLAVAAFGSAPLDPVHL